jgi:pilus assembly protein Flp/PilA
MLSVLQYYTTALSARTNDDEGATATEYIVLLVFIALAIIAGAIIFGGALNNAFSTGATRVGTGL